MRFLIKNIKKKQLNNIIYAIVQLFMLFFIYLIIDIQDKGVQIQFDLIIATIVYLFNFMINTDTFKEDICLLLWSTHSIFSCWKLCASDFSQHVRCRKH